MNLTSEQRIQQAHVRMMSSPATMAYSSVLMVGSTELRCDIPTAATNGRDVYYNDEFVATLSDAELIAVALHENMHKVFRHQWLWKHLWKENAQLANMAADYVINLEILDLSKKYPTFLTLPASALVDEKFRGMSTPEVFNALKDQGEDGGGGGGFDEHNFDELSEEEREAVTTEIDQAVRQGALLASKLGGNVDRAFESLMEPQVDWREQLSEFMTYLSGGKDDSTWRRPNRRWLSQDIYLPSYISTTMGPLVVGIDTSGSLGMKELASFLSEIVALCETVKPEVLHLIECDATIQSHEVFGQDSLGQVAAKRSMKGGGGTDMRVIFDYIKKNNIKPEAVIVLTDGYTPWPEQVEYPTLWGITTKYITAPVGTSLYITV